MANQGFNFNIPHVDCVPLPPLNVLQGHYASWHSNTLPRWVPGLWGKTLEEVEREAAQIQCGDHFSFVGQFNHCLHSWGVLNGQTNHLLKTQWHFALRVQIWFQGAPSLEASIARPTGCPTITDKKDDTFWVDPLTIWSMKILGLICRLITGWSMSRVRSLGLQHSPQ